LVGVGSLPDLQKDLLRDILRLLAVAHCPVSKIEHPVLMPDDKRPEGSCITLSDFVQQGLARHLIGRGGMLWHLSREETHNVR